MLNKLLLEPSLRIQKINDSAIIPKRANVGDSGLDLFSTDDCIVEPNSVALVGTGWKMAVPLGFEIQIRPRSGLALRKQITVGNSPGSIDFSYRGEVKVILSNSSKIPFVVRKGDKIAQMIIAPIELWEPEVVDELDETERGSGGFGSTGER